MNNKIFVPFLLLLVSLTWAGSFVVVNLTVEEISPIDLGFLRFLIATPFMILFLIFKRKLIKIPIKEIIPLSVLGLTGVTFLYIFQFTGIDLTTASTAAVLINTNVIFIAILSAIFLKEKFTIKKIIGVILSFFGVIVIMCAQMFNDSIIFGNDFLIGCLLVILSAFCWAIYSIVGKNLLTKYDPLTITTYAFVLGSIFYLPFISLQTLNVVQNISINSLMAIFYLALLCSVFGYLAWYYVLTKIDTSKAAVFLNFIPLFTIIISFFYGESPTIFFVLGAILIVYGVYLTQKG